ncbi:hypothetical protein B0H63DRAFT_26221 [Podospora didyma]|uniref:G-patch domain-containing protein n=1 Tax=Podospora didyma TaxID=330526 RepID=A0AAE0P5P1_9PEZI|nr:hypothetical protein B0H63DRAFT_26221 [Podospora didyma]
MNAAALLQSQGWRGKGFSLHPTDNDIGLAKPLCLSRNTDGRGVGQKKHYTSDQWWLHAFDEKLKGLDTSKGAVVQSVTKGKLDVVASSVGNGKYTGAAGLYSSFVRGEGLSGTLTPETETSTTTSTSSKGSLGETKEERKARRAARKLRKAKQASRKAAEEKAKQKAAAKAAKKEAKAVKKETKLALKATETKDERRARRAERRARKEARRKPRKDKG